MKHLAKAGMDVASLLIFDPSALPSDYEQRRPKEKLEIVRKLHQEQRVFLVETGADGAYLIHAFVDEPIPDSLKPFVREPQVHDRFEAPSGKIL
jgi:hypothetical protein